MVAYVHVYSRILEASHDLSLRSGMPHISGRIIIVIMFWYLIPAPYGIGNQEPINDQVPYDPASRSISCGGPFDRPLISQLTGPWSRQEFNSYVFDYREH